MTGQSCFAPWCGIDGKYGNPGVCNQPGGHRYKAEPVRPLTVMQAHEAADCPDRENCWARDIHDEHSPRHQVVDDVVRDLVSEYLGTIQSVTMPTPDTALVRLHRGDSTWLVSIARLAVSDD